MEAILKLNSCLADIRRWMITNKLKINYSVTELIVFRCPQLKCSLSVNIGESIILNFDDHITVVEAHVFISKT